MAQTIDLEKAEIVEIHARGIQLTVYLEEGKDRVLTYVESEEGGKKILIGAHEELKNTIYFGIDNPVGLRIVKD